VASAYDSCEFHVVYQRLSQFIAVELSAIYHDVIKDRMYTDAAGSPRRRATQTTLWRLVTHLCQMLSPILAFTADEAWEFIPGKPAPSVHLSDWEPVHFDLETGEVGEWNRLFQLRELVLPELEKARAAKHIGKALEAKVTLTCPAGEPAGVTLDQDALRELLNVSQLDIAEANVGQVQVTVTKASGEKCERCWHWETDVGSDSSHPTLCGRCTTAVTLAG